MGGSNWNDDFYRGVQDHKAATNTPTFAHHATVQRAVASGAKATAHHTLDVLGKTRESRDSVAHPMSKPIAVFFDQTGSMGDNPKVLQRKLPQLMSFLLRKGYVVDPQILMGAVGDYFSDQVPFQAGQFESGVEMDADLSNIYLEGNGGGNGGESYLLPMYFLARHTATDAWEKRQEKGHAFIVGDEPCHQKLTKAEALKVFGDTLERDLTAQEVIAEVQERWNIFFVIPKHAGARIKDHWQGLVGAENVLNLDNADSVCECIALSTGICEGTVDLEAGASHLKDAGASANVVNSVTSALDPLAKKTALARAGTGDLPARKGKSKTTVRL